LKPLKILILYRNILKTVILFGSLLRDGYNTIGITLYASGTGALLFSSNWSGTQTVEQILGGGNVQMR